MRSDVISGPRPARPRQEPSRAVESHPPSGAAAAVEPLLFHFFGGPPPVRVQFWDGTALGPADGDTLQVRSRDAVRRLLWSPGELGLARAFVAGDVDFDGDLFEILASLHAASPARVRDNSRLPWQAIRAAYRLGALGRPIPPPPEEAAPQGRLHSRTRDAQVVRHHYDVSNDFYAMVLGPSMTYSCRGIRRMRSRWKRLRSRSTISSVASSALSDRAGQRILDVGCGWGSFAIHATRATRRAGGRCDPQPRAGAVGTTSGWQPPGSIRQVEIRLQDSRDVRDGTFDGISSVGMFEHVGTSKSAEYFGSHAPTDQARGQAAQPRHLERGRIEHRLEIVHRAIRLPDGELIDMGKVVPRWRKRALRSAMSSPSVSTTSRRSGPGWATSSSIGRPRSRSGCAGHASGSSTWRRRPTGSRTAGSRSTRCSASSPHRTGGAACRQHGAPGPEVVHRQVARSGGPSERAGLHF